MPARGRIWVLAVATVGFALFAYGMLGLAVLALAALLLVAAKRSPDWILAGVAAGGGLAFVVLNAIDPFDTAVGAYSGVVAAAFAGGVLLAPVPVWRQAVRATGWGAAATGALGLALRGTGFWSELQWSVMHQTSSAVRGLIERWPNSFPMYDPMVQFFGTAFPALLMLQTLAALALAWQWHQRLAATPLGPPLAPFRQFRFGDHWVWGLVVTLLVWAVPKLAALKGVALNLGIVLSVLYCLRGAAIVAALAGGMGVPVWTLSVATVVAVALVLPLLLLIPGLWTLGVFDTWLAFRQRRAGQSPVR
jgi:hypothetical protein